LRFFPGMDIPSERKTRLLVDVLRILQRHHELVPMSVHAERLRARAGLPARVPA